MDVGRRPRVLGVVPARAGSKRLANKNMRMVAGRSLIEWTAREVRASGSLSRCLVSTDSEELAVEARRCGLEVPFKRPKELSGDRVPTLDVLRHALSHAEGEGDMYDLVCLLQVTSPLRRSVDIDDAVSRIWSRKDADSITSCAKIPAWLSPRKLLKIEPSGMARMLDASAEGEAWYPQLLQFEWLRNGPAVLVSRSRTLQHSLLGERTLAFEMPWLRSLDIDTLEDLELVEALLMRSISPQEF